MAPGRSASFFFCPHSPSTPRVLGCTFFARVYEDESNLPRVPTSGVGSIGRETNDTEKRVMAMRVHPLFHNLYILADIFPIIAVDDQAAGLTNLFFAVRGESPAVAGSYDYAFPRWYRSVKIHTTPQ